MTNGISEEGTEEGTGLVKGDNVGAEEVHSSGGHVVEMELVLERAQGKGSADEGTIVADHA